MAQNSLTYGPVHTLVQNTSYATPGRMLNKIRVQGSLESSLDESTWLAVTLVNGEAEVAAPFVRSTASGTLIRLTHT